MQQPQKTPTNLITGLLGVGKTSAIVDLLKSRPQTGRWAVLVNEFGQVPIDQTAFERAGEEGLQVREVAGGCLCCSGDVPLKVAVLGLLRQIQSDRLLIELSGLGHPGQVMDELRSERLRELLDIRTTVCLVDPRDFDDPYVVDSQVFQDQVHMADVLVANKEDLAENESIDRFLDWARGLFPPKIHIASTRGGRLDPTWLDLETSPLRVPMFPDAHVHPEEPADEHFPSLENNENRKPSPAPGRPHRVESEGLGHYACGWIFSPEDVFDDDRLMSLLAAGDSIERLKGVFRIGGEWILVNRVGKEIDSQPVAYRRDSRLEVISKEPPDTWSSFEKTLVGSIKH